MLGTEARILSDLAELGASVLQQTADHQFAPAFVEDGMRRFIVLVPHGNEAHHRWPLMVEALRTTREQLRAKLQQLAQDQQLAIDAGVQSTSMPQWVRPGEVCSDVRFSIAPAYRSGVIDAASIIPFIQARAARVSQALENSEKYRHKQRIPSLLEQQQQIASDLAAFAILHAAQGNNIVARLSSGIGTHIAFKFGKRSDVLTMPHMLLVTVEPGVAVRQAARHQGTKKYGEPLLRLLNDTLHIHQQQVA